MLEPMGPKAGARTRVQILAEIRRLGPCLPGTITERTTRCQSPGCRCQGDSARRHGPYRLWTRKVAGKTVTKTLTAAQVARYQPWLDNKRRLDELVAELEQLSVTEMATNEGWPLSAPPPPDRRRRADGHGGEW